MPEVEIVHEPRPGPLASGKTGMGVTIRLIEAKTGEVVSVHHSELHENERRTRDERVTNSISSET